MAAPTLVSYTEVASWATGGATKATASVSWNSGDILVVIAGAENNANTLGTPTATGLTFTIKQSFASGTTCSSMLATATAGSTSSATVNVAYGTTGGSPHWGFGVWVWRSSTGEGNSIEQHTTTKTKALTITSPNSAVMCGVFDFNADAAGSGTPAVTNSRQAAQDAGRYTRLVFDNIDYSTSGSLWGQTGGGTTGPFSIVAVEIKNDGAGGATTRGTPFGHRGTAFNGGRTFHGIINRQAFAMGENGLLVPDRRIVANDRSWKVAA